MVLLTLILVAGTAGAGWWMLHNDVAATSGPDDRRTSYRTTSEPSGSVPSTLLKPGSDYYIHVKLIEFRPVNEDDNPWDRGSGSAPDIAFKLNWNGTLLYEAPTRDDTLIAEWDLLRLDLKEALLSGQVDLASAINAPLINCKEGGVLTIEIWDEDTIFDDPAGKFDLPLSTLKEGINTITPESGGIARLVIDIVPRDLSLPDLLERASNR